MKSLLVLVLLIAVVGVYSHDHMHMGGASEGKTKLIHEDIEKCIVESKVDRQLLDDMKAEKKFTATKELDCFSACIMKKEGLMNQDGTINQDQPNDSDARKECKKLTGADECETAGKVIKCFIDNGLLPKM